MTTHSTHNAQTASSTESVVHRGESFTTPDKLKAEALELGSTMAYSAAEYIENLHRLHAKALVEIDRLRKALDGRP
jgi:hypothetical protein